MSGNVKSTATPDFRVFSSRPRFRQISVNSTGASGVVTIFEETFGDGSVRKLAVKKSKDGGGIHDPLLVEVRHLQVRSAQFPTYLPLPPSPI